MTSYSEGDLVMVTSKVKISKTNSGMVLGTIAQVTANGALILDAHGYMHKVEQYEIYPYQNIEVDSE